VKEDQIIKQIIEDKNIPFQIEGTDSYFYDLDKDVEKNLLEKMV
jgi:hypothetical protein